MLRVPGQSVWRKFWREAQCKQTNMRSQTARAGGPGDSGPDFGPRALGFRPNTARGPESILSKARAIWDRILVLLQWLSGQNRYQNDHGSPAREHY